MSACRLVHDFSIEGIARWANLSLYERVADRAADLLMDADELLWMVERASAVDSVREAAPRLRRVCDELDALLKQLVE